MCTDTGDTFTNLSDGWTARDRAKKEENIGDMSYTIMIKQLPFQK